jgi:uncharacterized membrane protein
VTEIATICTESGIWQPIAFDCVFDPLAVNLKEGSTFGWASFGGNGQMNMGTIATIGVLATLVVLVLIIVVIFFTHRRIAEENQSRKVSRSSTNQLIADVANGLAAHIDGPDPPAGGGGLMASPQNNLTSMLVAVDPNSPCSPFHASHTDLEHSHPATNMTSFRPHPSANTILPLPPPGSDCGRSAGDGGSMVDESNYATVKNLCDEDLELMDEESHYALVRKPDGRADEPTYSTLRYTQVKKVKKSRSATKSDALLPEKTKERRAMMLATKASTINLMEGGRIYPQIVNPSTPVLILVRAVYILVTFSRERKKNL